MSHTVGSAWSSNQDGQVSYTRAAAMVHQVKPCLSTPSHCFAEDLVQCIKNGAASSARKGGAPTRRVLVMGSPGRPATRKQMKRGAKRLPMSEEEVDLNFL